MQTITIKEAENVLKEIMNEEDDRFQLLMKDDRKGV
ncbi:ribonuclease HII, partial [Bacillus thuringiensis]|nr:ribonuclease HII [Bacillus thuringiensis]